jgi:hypothetical protein
LVMMLHFDRVFCCLSTETWLSFSHLFFLLFLPALCFFPQTKLSLYPPSWLRAGVSITPPRHRTAWHSCGPGPAASARQTHPPPLPPPPLAAPGIGHWALGTGPRAPGSGFQAPGAGHRTPGSGRRATGARRRAPGPGHRVLGSPAPQVDEISVLTARAMLASSAMHRDSP